MTDISFDLRVRSNYTANDEHKISFLGSSDGVIQWKNHSNFEMEYQKSKAQCLGS